MSKNGKKNTGGTSGDRRYHRRHPDEVDQRTVLQEQPSLEAIPKRQVALTHRPATHEKKHIDTSLLLAVVGVITTGFVALLQWNGVVSIRWAFSLAGYALLTACSLLAFWKWEVSSSWSKSRRIAVFLALMTALSGISGLGVVTQYQREHTQSQHEREVLDRLRDKYIKENHDKVTPGLISGREDPPADWLNAQLELMNESFRFSAGPTRPASAITDPRIEAGPFREEVDVLTFHLGERGISASAKLSDLAEGKSTLFDLYGFKPVTVEKKGDNLSVDVTLWGGTGKPPLEIRGNHFKVNTPSGWDRNANDNAIEVVSPTGKVIFQMIRRTPTDVVFNGIFPLPNGMIFVAGPNGAIGPLRAVPDDFVLHPIFKYPSWKYPGKFAD